MPLHAKVHITPHIDFTAEVAAGGAVARCGPCLQSAALLFIASHPLTYFRGCHRWTGGPQRERNINDEMWGTVNLLLRLQQIRFILLKPLSHSVVLTGIVFTQFNKR